MTGRCQMAAPRSKIGKDFSLHGKREGFRFDTEDFCFDVVRQRNVQILPFGQDDNEANPVILTEGKDLYVLSRGYVLQIRQLPALNENTLHFARNAVILIGAAQPARSKDLYSSASAISRYFSNTASSSASSSTVAYTSLPSASVSMRRITSSSSPTSSISSTGTRQM